jgi:hypothetical protein
MKKGNTKTNTDPVAKWPSANSSTFHFCFASSDFCENTIFESNFW